MNAAMTLFEQALERAAESYYNAFRKRAMDEGNRGKYSPPKWGELDEHFRQQHRRDSRAAVIAFLKAVREPTMDMEGAAKDATGWQQTTSQFVPAFQAMIDRLIREGEATAPNPRASTFSQSVPASKGMSYMEKTAPAAKKASSKTITIPRKKKGPTAS